jgi:DNA-binding FrmR family transcriptional regulator
MAHTTKEKEKLLVPVRRIRGQVDAIERALESETECAGILQLMAACRGALNGLIRPQFSHPVSEVTVALVEVRSKAISTFRERKYSTKENRTELP